MGKIFVGMIFSILTICCLSGSAWSAGGEGKSGRVTAPQQFTLAEPGVATPVAACRFIDITDIAFTREHSDLVGKNGEEICQEARYRHCLFSQLARTQLRCTEGGRLMWDRDNLLVGCDEENTAPTNNSLFVCPSGNELQSMFLTAVFCCN